jgi:hypothetical protein
VEVVVLEQVLVQRLEVLEVEEALELQGLKELQAREITVDQVVLVAIIVAEAEAVLASLEQQETAAEAAV